MSNQEDRLYREDYMTPQEHSLWAGTGAEGDPYIPERLQQEIKNLESRRQRGEITDEEREKLFSDARDRIEEIRADQELHLPESVSMALGISPDLIMTLPLLEKDGRTEHDPRLIRLEEDKEGEIQEVPDWEATRKWYERIERPSPNPEGQRIGKPAESFRRMEFPSQRGNPERGNPPPRSGESKG